MEETTRHDIRRLLKTFGVQADEAIIRYLERNPDMGLLRVRITLEGITDYGGQQPSHSLHLVVEGEIRREP